MNRALLFLWYAQRRNAVLRYLRRFLQPRQLLRALLPLAAAALVVFAVVQGARQTAPRDAASFLAGALAAYLLLDVFRGLSEPGIAFEPAEVDFLFPGPFSRSSLVLYHLLSTYARSLVSILLFYLFFGVHTPRPGLSLLGTALALVVGEHVRVVAALLAVRAAERTVARLTGSLRFVGLGVALLLVFLMVPSLAERSGLGGGLARALDSGWARALFYPAVAAADLSSAPSLAAAARPLAGLLACALATLGILLALQVHFLEASLVTSQRRAAVLERIRRSRRMVPTADPNRPTRSVRLRSGPLFRGAGAVFWRNLVVARRSGRALFFSSMFSLLFLLPAFLGIGRDPTFAVALGALLPLVLSSAVAFDFRGEADQMDRLKTLPVSPSRLALAEVAGSATVAVAFQALLLLALVAFADLGVGTALAAVVGYVPVTVGLLAAANLAHLLAPRAPFLTFLLQVGFLVVNALVLGVPFALLNALGVTGAAALPPLLAIQVALTSAALWSLGATWRRYDVGSSAS